MGRLRAAFFLEGVVGVANGQSELDRYGCEYGRSLAKDVAYLREDLGEVKTDVKTLVTTVTRIEQLVQSGKSSGGKRGNSKEFWASLVALATALTAVAMTLAKVR